MHRKSKTAVMMKMTGKWKTAAMIMTWLIIMALGAQAEQRPAVDPEADRILRAMSDYLASLPGFHLEAQTSYDSVLDSGQVLTYFNRIAIDLKRPDRLHIDRKGMIRDQEYFFDGRRLSVFSRRRNMYATVDHPGSVQEMLQDAADRLNLVAPGIDLLSPDVYHDLTAEVSQGVYVGRNTVNGVDCHHLAFRTGEVDWQIWIGAGEQPPLPHRFSITSKWTTGAPRYVISITRWVTDSVPADDVFRFTPPEKSLRIGFLGLEMEGERTTGNSRGKEERQ